MAKPHDYNDDNQYDADFLESIGADPSSASGDNDCWDDGDHEYGDFF